MSNVTGRMALLTARNTFSIDKYPVLPAGDDSITIEVALCGVCGSDVHFAEVLQKYPMALGHEVVGRVVDIGKNAMQSIKYTKPFQLGDRVVVYPGPACGHCYWDRYYGNNHTYVCETTPPACDPQKPPYFYAGFGDYYCVAPGMWVSIIPDDLPWDAAVLVEPLSIAIRSVERGMSLPAWKNEQTLAFGGTAAVLGAGGIGVLTAACAKIAGAAKVILIGAPQGALDLAAELGFADETIDITKVSPAERIAKVKEMTYANAGADMVFEAAGSAKAFSEALDMVRKLGTVVESGCFVDTGETVPINVARQINEKDVAIFASRSQAPQTFDKALSTLASTANRFDWERLITKFPLNEIQKAFVTGCGDAKSAIKNAVIASAYDK